MNAPINMLVKLARQSASTWTALAAQAFRGEASLETSNTIYRFRDGMFVSCATKPSQVFTAPEGLRDLRLVGFLAYENGLWSLSPRWRQGAAAVFWRAGGVDERSFIVTSATVSWVLEAPASVSERERVPISGVVRRMGSRPPTLRPPTRESMTRVLPAAAAVGDPR